MISVRFYETGCINKQKKIFFPGGGKNFVSFNGFNFQSSAEKIKSKNEENSKISKDEIKDPRFHSKDVKDPRFHSKDVKEPRFHNKDVEFTVVRVSSSQSVSTGPTEPTPKLSTDLTTKPPTTQPPTKQPASSTEGKYCLEFF